MNIGQTFSTIAAMTASVIALSTRIYQIFHSDMRSSLGNSVQNQLLHSTLTNAARTIRQRENAPSILRTIAPAGLMVLSAYPIYAFRRPNTARPEAARPNAARSTVARLAALPAATPSQKFEERLHAIQCEAPEHFNDPISMTVMENPVIAKTSCVNRGREQITEHVYDQSTFERLNGICPENRLPFIEVKPHHQLKKTITDFVHRKEKEHLAAQKKKAIKKKHR